MSLDVTLKNKRILVVEDVELNQYLARHIMESWGCIVEVVENGSIAVERVGKDDFDLVLMDIQMPVMDGIEATRIIRSIPDEYKSSIPIVALTANAMKMECENYLHIGMNDWLAKPFEEASLYKTVSRNIRKTVKINVPPAETTSREESSAKKSSLYNLAMIEAISGGDKSFIEKMLLLFLETVPKTLNDLQHASESSDWQLLGKYAHKLKSTIDSMGIISLKEIIREIEVGSKSGEDPAKLPELVQKVLRVMGEVMEEVREREVNSKQ